MQRPWPCWLLPNWRLWSNFPHWMYENELPNFRQLSRTYGKELLVLQWLSWSMYEKNLLSWRQLLRSNLLSWIHGKALPDRRQSGWVHELIIVAVEFAMLVTWELLPGSKEKKKVWTISFFKKSKLETLTPQCIHNPKNCKGDYWVGSGSEPKIWI